MPVQDHRSRSNLCCLDLMSAPYLLNALNDFLQTCVKCLPYRHDVQHPCSRRACSRSRSQFKVNGSRPGFRVRSITHNHLEGFSSNLGQIFALSRRCTEPMFQVCLLKVKVTRVCSISAKCLEGFSSNFGQMFALSRCAEQ